MKNKVLAGAVFSLAILTSVRVFAQTYEEQHTKEWKIQQIKTYVKNEEIALKMLEQNPNAQDSTSQKYLAEVRKKIAKHKALLKAKDYKPEDYGLASDKDIEE